MKDEGVAGSVGSGARSPDRPGGSSVAGGQRSITTGDPRPTSPAAGPLASFVAFGGSSVAGPWREGVAWVSESATARASTGDGGSTGASGPSCGVAGLRSGTAPAIAGAAGAGAAPSASPSAGGEVSTG